MREISFRWKSSLTWQRVYWFYAYTSRFSNTNDYKKHIVLTNSYEFFEVEPNTVLLYTWLEDKNLKEIYEGDYIKYEWNSRIREVYRDQVKLQYRIRCYWNTSDTTCDYSMEWLVMEVVGNIHENPELLK